MASDKRFAVCVDNTDYSAALELRKIYQVLPDPVAASRTYLRIIDESGGAYLYPRRMFLPVKFGPEVRSRLVKVLSCTRRKSPKRPKKTQSRRAANQRGKVRRPGSAKRLKAI
jgi:hypothetical protein